MTETLKLDLLFKVVIGLLLIAAFCLMALAWMTGGPIRQAPK
jgi:hypothetical protein